MRNIKDITIHDGDNSYKFRLTQLSALKLERWVIRAGVALAKSGLLDVDTDAIKHAGGDALTATFDAIMNKGFSFIGGIDADDADNLIMALVSNTAVRVADNSFIKVDENELDAIFVDIKSLVSLQKECFLINFPFLQSESQSSSATVSAPTTKTSAYIRKISAER